MGKLQAALRTQTGPQGAIGTEQTSSVTTYNGAEGFEYDAKSQLFLLAVQNFVGENTFYESAGDRDHRYQTLIRLNAVKDPVWTADFLKWLRTGANMRSASIVGAVEAARVLSQGRSVPAGQTGHVLATPVTPRQILNSVLLRADEPAEALGYWLSTYGKPLPKWLKRSLADSARRLYTPFNVLKWDSERNPVRMADVVELSQAKGADVLRDPVFKYLLDARHGRGNPADVDMFLARHQFNEIPVGQRRDMLLVPGFHDVLRAAGLTWEAISGWLQGAMTADVWEVAIPHMRIGALIKNLANFERAGIRTGAAEHVRQVLVDESNVQQSRLLPMAFLNAYNNVPGDTFKAALDDAATLSIGNIDPLAGRTLILVDTSGSMNAQFTTHRGRVNPEAEILHRWDAAALFGIALGRRCEHADVVSFSAPGYSHMYSWSGRRSGVRRDDIGYKEFLLRPGENLLASVARFKKDYFIGGGTDTAGAVRNTYRRHDRVIILTDEQADVHDADVVAPVPHDVPVYTFNLAGYRTGHTNTGRNRFTVGGLSDAGFQMLSILEKSRNDRWPWQSV